MLRGGRPVVIGVSTNDGLSGSVGALAALLQRKNYYFIPFGQDDSYKKPCSLKADFTQLPDTLEAALRGAAAADFAVKPVEQSCFVRVRHMIEKGALVWEQRGAVRQWNISK